MMLVTDENRADRADAADHDPSRDAPASQATPDPYEEEPTAAGGEIDHLDTAALKQCIRANLWP
jgi:hypothetical protein